MRSLRLGLGLRTKTLRLCNEVRYFAANTFGKPHLYNLNTPERVGCVYNEPTDMCSTDRLMLYALVRGLRPKFALEIGVRWGGSARIITNAMEENGMGQLVGIDPLTKAFRAKPAELHGRYTLIEGHSPDATPKAAKILGGPVEFVFIDALHIYDAVLKDFSGVLPHLADSAHILFHDTYHQGIDQAVRDVITINPNFVDCGFITRNPSIGYPVSFQGLRLIRKGTVNSEKLITEAYERNNQRAPPFSPDIWNFDEYYNMTKDLKS
jgi:predicted O-methyltransferase YrrM